MTTEEIILKEFGEALAASIPKLIELFSRAGSRDGFLTAIDASLEVARRKTDAEILSKPRT